MENTFVMIKPDGVRRRLIGKVIQRFEEKGLYLAAATCMVPTKEILHIHYAHLSDKPFFKDMVEYMASGMVFIMVWSGVDAVTVGRKLVGETNPADAALGTIRGDYSMSVGRNIIHSSDSAANAEKEIKLWLGDGVTPAAPFDKDWIYD